MFSNEYREIKGPGLRSRWKAFETYAKQKGEEKHSSENRELDEGVIPDVKLYTELRENDPSGKMKKKTESHEKNRVIQAQFIENSKALHRNTNRSQVAKDNVNKLNKNQPEVNVTTHQKTLAKIITHDRKRRKPDSIIGKTVGPLLSIVEGFNCHSN